MLLRRSFIVVFVIALVSGCGGHGKSSGVANIAPSRTGTTAAAAAHGSVVPFAGCMRSHGVRRYPDVGKPTPQQAGVSTEQFERAVTACKHLLPNGGRTTNTQQTRRQLADELSFARCMRRDGVRNFPDPTEQEGLTVAMVEAQRIDVHSQRILRVVQKCLPASHGGLTAAKVRAAIENAG